MTRTLRVKIRCPHCQAKIDITSIEPDTYVDCPVCYEPFLTPLEEDYEELSVYPYSDQRYQRDKTHHFSTRRNIVSQVTLRKMQRRKNKVPFLVFGGIIGLIFLIFLFAVSRQSLHKPAVPAKKAPATAKESRVEKRTFSNIIPGSTFFALRPDNLDFREVMNEVKIYLDRKDGITRIFEKKRFSILVKLRDNLLNGLKKYPFEGILKLHSGYANGQISSFSEKGIYIRNTETSLIEWEKIDPRAYAELLTHVALNKASDVSLKVSGKNLSLLHNTGLSYFHAAVLLDWYGYKSSAADYKVKALQLSPSLASDIREILP